MTSTLDTHFAALRTYLGFPWPEGSKVRYQKFRNRADLLANGECSSMNDSCFFAKLGVQTHRGFDQHELVHAYLLPLGDSHPFLEEGVAEALSCGAKPLFRNRDITIETAFSLAHWEAAARPELDRLYRAATWFVGDLLRHHGSSRFLELYAAVRREHQTAAAVDRVFAEVLGESLSTAWARAMSSEPSGICVRAWECAAPLWNEEQTQWFESCSQNDHGRSLSLETPAWLLAESAGWGFLVGSCDPKLQMPTREFESAAGGHGKSSLWFGLRPGRYFAAKHPSSPRVGLMRVPMVGGLLTGFECEKTEPLVTDFEHDVVIALHRELLDGLPPDGATIRWRDVDDDATDYAVECAPEVRAMWCRECDQTSCEPACDMNVVVPHRKHPGEEVILRVVSPWAEPTWLRIHRLR